MMRKAFYLCCFSFLFLQCSSNQENTAAIKADQDLPKNAIALHQEEIAHAIREIIENRLPEERYLVFEQELYSSFLLPEFYVKRAFQNAWIQHIDSLELVNEFIEYIEGIEHHGLQPEHYHLESIKNIRDSILDKSKPFNANRIAQLDLLLSDAFFMLSSHLYNGKVDIENLTATWNIRRDKPQLALDKKLEILVNVKHPALFMRKFYPQHPGYETMIAEVKKLKNKLPEDYQVTIQIPEGAHSVDLKTDSIYAEIIYKKLRFLGYVKTDTLDYISDKQGLIEVVKLLQKSHGIRPDGQVGKNTIRALNHSIQDKIDALYVNAERMRWLPDSLNKRHIMVNIADFTLDFISNRDTLISMRTVVGRDFRQTPVFNARMTYLVFSPTWTVPPTIMKNDVIPAVAKNINYLKSHHMKIIDANGNEISPASIDWQRAKTRGTIPYRIRQEPGSHNALGRVKFMFPNKYNVYLHDTPSKELFDRDSRTFSSGCIRVDKPFELARLLLGDSIKWSAEEIKTAMYANRERTVVLKNPVDVYIFYLTAWSDGYSINYRQDVYGRDQAVLKALKQKKQKAAK
jgi:murein L,D-transpeptidase YcbB/YkuD